MEHENIPERSPVVAEHERKRFSRGRGEGSVLKKRGTWDSVEASRLHWRRLRITPSKRGRLLKCGKTQSESSSVYARTCLLFG